MKASGTVNTACSRSSLTALFFAEAGALGIVIPPTPLAGGCCRRSGSKSPPAGKRTNEREKLERVHLAAADRHIADATARIAGVRARTADLERDGRDASAARDALEAREGMLELMHHHRDVIARLLETRAAARTN
jgi:hypothetical protein